MTLYSFDTSVLIESWNRRLLPATFVSFWERLDETISAGLVQAVDEVRNELSNRDDNLKAWAKLRGHMFVPLEHDIQRATTRVLEYAERMVGMGKGRNGADPFVIALAVARDGVVVTEEYKGSLAKPKIPSVCEALGVRCLTTVEFIQEQGWTF